MGQIDKYSLWSKSIHRLIHHTHTERDRDRECQNWKLLSWIVLASKIRTVQGVAIFANTYWSIVVIAIGLLRYSCVGTFFTHRINSKVVEIIKSGENSYSHQSIRKRPPVQIKTLKAMVCYILLQFDCFKWFPFFLSIKFLFVVVFVYFWFSLPLAKMKIKFYLSFWFKSTINKSRIFFQAL